MQHKINGGIFCINRKFLNIHSAKKRKFPPCNGLQKYSDFTTNRFTKEGRNSKNGGSPKLEI